MNNRTQADDIRHDITRLITASRPQLIRESALLQVLEKKGYTPGGIRGVFNAYMGRSGHKEIPHVQAVKIASSTYYRYSFKEKTEITDAKKDLDVKNDDIGLFIKKDSDVFFLLNAERADQEQLAREFHVETIKPDITERMNRKLATAGRIMAIQDILYEHFEDSNRSLIQIEEIIQKANDYEIFGDETIDDEEVRVYLQETLMLEPHFDLSESDGAVYNNQPSDSPGEVTEFYVLEKVLNEALRSLKKLQIQALKDGDAELLGRLHAFKEIEHALNDYFFKKTR